MTNQLTHELAPELEVREWLNTDNPISLSDLRGKVVLIEAFQMLCPGCVSHSLPQAMNVAQIFSADDLVVIGLHTVFEHHGAQGTREALAAFLEEYRITFPVAIDAPSIDDRIPRTMARYQMRGTPTLLLIDRLGRLRKHQFGRIEDLKLGAELMTLIGEKGDSIQDDPDSNGGDTRDCDVHACPVPD